MSDPYESLANATILQAVKDWRDSVKKLKKRPRFQPAMDMKKECEEFFLSDYYKILSSVDGEWLLTKLKKEAGIE